MGVRVDVTAEGAEYAEGTVRASKWEPIQHPFAPSACFAALRLPSLRLCPLCVVSCGRAEVKRRSAPLPCYDEGRTLWSAAVQLPHLILHLLTFAFTMELSAQS